MNKEDLLTLPYDEWKLENFTLPVRSKLYHTSPINVGMPFVESLTSYIIRLAERHSLSVRDLVVEVFFPLFGRSYLLDQKGGNNTTTFWKDAPALNGVNISTVDWVRVTEELTLYSDLHILTMLSWSNVLSPKALLRRSHAWCPFCYEEWRANKQIIYDPLLWSLEVVTICPHHNTSLLLQCPYADCKRSVQVLAPRARSGYCSHCSRWLGMQDVTRIDSQISSPGYEKLRWQQWVIVEMGKLLTAAPRLAIQPQKECFAEAVETYLYEVADGNVSAVARKFQVAGKTVREWKKGLQLPQLSSLLKFCYLCGLSPLNLFTEGFKIKGALHEFNRAVFESKPTKYYREFNPGEIRQALEAELHSNEYPPPPMSKVAKRLRYDPSFLYKYFPELCRNISAKFEKYRSDQCEERKRQIVDEVRQATLKVHFQDIYPSQVRVRNLLTKPGSIRIPEALATWHTTLKELGWEK